MTQKLQKKFIHCMTRSKRNQNSNHILIFTKLMIIIKKINHDIVKHEKPEHEQICK
jgi:hypothetical protein